MTSPITSSCLLWPSSSFHCLFSSQGFSSSFGWSSILVQMNRMPIQFHLLFLVMFSVPSDPVHVFSKFYHAMKSAEFFSATYRLQFSLFPTVVGQFSVPYSSLLNNTAFKRRNLVCILHSLLFHNLSTSLNAAFVFQSVSLPL